MKKNLKYEAVIFDMDGTIVDTDTIWEKVTLEILARRNIQLSDQVKQYLFQRMAGAGLTSCCALLKKELQLDDHVDDLMHEKLQLSSQLYAEQVKYINGFTDFMTKIKQHEIKVALATNANSRTVRITDQKLNLAAYFGEHMYTIDHVTKGKPDPSIYLHSAAQIGTLPTRCVAIEDSAHGIAAAVDAGMFCIGFNAAQRHEQVMKSHVIVDSYEAIDIEKLLFFD